MNPNPTLTFENDLPKPTTHAVPEKSQAAYSTFVSNGVEYARKTNGQVIRITPKPLSKKERNRLRKANI